MIKLIPTKDGMIIPEVLRDVHKQINTIATVETKSHDITLAELRATYEDESLTLAGLSDEQIEESFYDGQIERDDNGVLTERGTAALEYSRKVLTEWHDSVAFIKSKINAAGPVPLVEGE
jgi:hypothetical protein